MAQTDGQTENQVFNSDKMSHKKRKALMRKEKRKAKRQAQAKMLIDEKEISVSESEDEASVKAAELERQRQHELWLEREKKAQEEWQAKKERERKEAERKLEIEQQIREEWEERQKKEEEEKEEQEKIEKERKSKQDQLLREATANEHKDSWHNPIAPSMAGRDRDECPFFQKTGACRFAERCSRSHTMPESSRVLMFPGMFTNFRLQQSLVEDNDVDDLELEYDDNELYQNFEDFYNDVLPEFRSVGRVTQFKVSCNCEPHLRGNVYVQYKKEECAQRAFAKFNGRWYGGRQLSCAFVTINKWKSAICGLAFVKRCPKGKTCNFLHVFRNPCNEFWQADKDIYPGESNRDHRRDSRDYNSNQRERRHGSERRERYSENHDRDRSRYSSRKYDRSRSRSRSPRFRKRRRRSYSRSPESRSQSRKRSRSPHESRRKRSRSRSPKSKSRIRSRSRSPMSRSRKPLRSRSKSRRKSRSRSRSKSKSRMLSRSRSRSKSKRMSRSRSRSRSKVRNEVEHSNGRVVETPSVKSFRSDGSESDSGTIEHLQDKQKLKKHKKQKKKSKKHKHKHRSKKSETNSKFESSDTSDSEKDLLDKPNIIEIPPDNENDDFGDVVFEDVYV